MEVKEKKRKDDRYRLQAQRVCGRVRRNSRLTTKEKPLLHRPKPLLHHRAVAARLQQGGWCKCLAKQACRVYTAKLCKNFAKLCATRPPQQNLRGTNFAKVCSRLVHRLSCAPVACMSASSRCLRAGHAAVPATSAACISRARVLCGTPDAAFAAPMRQGQPQ